MMNILNAISSSILSKDILSLDTGEIRSLTTKHPYSGALQLLYAQKLKSENSPEFSAQWQKTLLFFNNPLLLQHFFTTVAASPDASSTTENTIYAEPIATPSTSLEDKSTSLEPFQEPTFIPPVEKEATAKNESEASIYTEDLKTKEDIPTSQAPTTAQNTPAGEALLTAPGLKIEAVDPAKAALSFTPYYTIDYFASQGIKISEDIKPDDAFGNQLKSFVNWLKEMRRLPESEVSSKLSNTEKKNVEKMAQTSLEGENAITQAMAEVWIKQSNPQKAIEIYKKLSLQNPSKSAFFAAKIDHLKKKL